MAYKVDFYINDRNESPVEEFINALSVKERAKCRAYIALLSERGNALPANIIKPLGGGIWELRPEFGGVEFRYFYFIAFVENRIVVLHAIKKKSQKVPERDIKLARKRKEEVEDG